MAQLALDTTFLIDLQNERRKRARSRGALAFLRSVLNSELLLPAVALAEYLEGFEDPESPEARALVAPLEVLEVTAAVAVSYARTAQGLRQSGQLIGTNDLWIACTALCARVPLVTRNVGEFRRVADLEVIGYGEPA